MRVVHTSLNRTSAPAESRFALSAPHLITAVDLKNRDRALWAGFGAFCDEPSAFNVFLFANMHF
jgi:hypothetical protein